MPCEIKSNRIYRDGKAVGFQQTKNVGGAIVPTVIVLHDTAGHLHGRDSIDWLLGGPGRSQASSAHVVIGRDGTITQLAATNMKTWHAGASSWRGRQMLNGWSIGIEIVNPGGPLTPLGNGRYKGVDLIDTKADPSLKVRTGVFPQRTEDGKPMPTNAGAGYWLEHSPQQIAAIVDLCRALVAAYPTITEIVTHWMIAPTRKVDTNPLFPLAEVRARVFDRTMPVGFGDIPLADDAGEDASATADEADAAPGPVDDGLYSDPSAAAAPAPDHAGPPKALVEFVQGRLRSLGYYEVGDIDGDFAGRTEDALVTFKRHNGLPPDPVLDQATLNALTSAEPREVGEARANATAKSLRKAVPAVQQAGRSKLLAWVLAAPSALFAALQGIASNVSSVMTQLAPITGWLSAVPGWAWALLILAIAGGIWWSSRAVETETVDAYRAGRLT